MVYSNSIRVLNLVTFFCLSLLLFSCGGNGVESEGTGDITLDKNKINMYMERLSNTPVDQIIISVSSTDVTYYNYSFVGEEPDWLNVYFGSENDVLIEATNNELPEGEYTTTLRIDITNEFRDIIGTQDVPVTLDIVAQFEMFAQPASLTFQGSENTDVLSQTITFTSNTGTSTFPDIWSPTNTVTEWLTTRNSPESDYVDVEIKPQPAGTYTHELQLLYYFNGSARWVYVPITYISL